MKQGFQITDFLLRSPHTLLPESSSSTSQHSSGPRISSSSSFQSEISLDATPPAMAKWGTDYQIAGTLSARGRSPDYSMSSSPSWTPGKSRTRRPARCMLYFLKDQKSRASCLKRSRETHESLCGSERNLKALVWDSKWKPSSTESSTESLWIQCRSSSNTGFTVSAHLSRRRLNSQADVRAGRRAGPVKLFWQMRVVGADPAIYSQTGRTSCSVHNNLNVVF